MIARALLALFLNMGGLTSLFAATTIAPNMKFPHTPIEWVATNLAVIGVLCTVLGMLVMAVRGR